MKGLKGKHHIGKVGCGFLVRESVRNGDIFFIEGEESHFVLKGGYFRMGGGRGEKSPKSECKLKSGRFTDQAG